MVMLFNYFNFRLQILLLELNQIQQRIYTIRDRRMMLDRDLAELFDTETRVLKQAVKRNINRFPADFLLKLTKEEVGEMVSQNVIPSKSYFGGSTPFAFTEHGVTMLANVIRSRTAIEMSIAIVRAFIALRQYALQYKELAEKIEEIVGRQDNYEAQLSQIYGAIESLLQEKQNKKALEEAWKNRTRIGFQT